MPYFCCVVFTKRPSFLFLSMNRFIFVFFFSYWLGEGHGIPKTRRFVSLLACTDFGQLQSSFIWSSINTLHPYKPNPLSFFFPLTLATWFTLQDCCISNYFLSHIFGYMPFSILKVYSASGSCPSPLVLFFYFFLLCIDIFLCAAMFRFHLRVKSFY